MSLLQNSSLEVPLQNAIELYNKEIVPRLTKKNKVIAISAAVALSLVYMIKERVLKPPRKLRHIPYISYWDTIQSIFRGDSVWDRAYNVYLPLVDSADNKGVFTVHITLPIMFNNMVTKTLHKYI
jgi:hypothetical protein